MHSEISTKRFPILSSIFVIIALAVCAYGYYCYHGFYHDDSFISLRYVQNYLAGNGLVWNAGERVEGYTNFFLVVLLSLLGNLGIDLVVASQLIGVTAFLLTIVVVWRFAQAEEREGRLHPILKTVPIVIIASSFPLIVWSVGGLESTLFSLLVVIGLCQAYRSLDGSLRSALLAGTSLAISALTRPEGLLFFFIVALFMAVRFLRGVEGARKTLTAFVSVFLTLYAPMIIWRYSYYGDIVPNTWYLKGEFSWFKIERGLSYLYSYAISLPCLLPITALSLLYAALRRAWSRGISLLALTLLGYMAYVFYIGGDHMQAFRFWVPAIPIMSILIYLAFTGIVAARRHFLSILVPSFIVVLVIVQAISPPEPVRRARIMDGAAFFGKIIGEYISTHWPEGSMVALNTAGSTPYYAPRFRFIDMLGLNDKTIAHRSPIPRLARFQNLPGHEKGDAQYVLSRKPDYLIAGFSTGDWVGNHWFLTEAELELSPDFRATYRDTGVVIPITDRPGYENYFQSRDGNVHFFYYRRL